MKVYSDIQQGTEEWRELKKGKISGTAIKRLMGSKTVRDGIFYELLAERLAIGLPEGENAMERGLRLEPDALSAFTKKTKKKVETVGFCESSFSKDIGNSPDGLIKVKGKYSEAVEVKCLSSAHFVEAWVTDEIPKEYYPQCVQYFITNDELKKLYFVLYDPRIEIHPLHTIELKRNDVLEDIEKYKIAEIDFLREVQEMEKYLRKNA